MPRPMGHIRILMSSRVLFDLEEADKVFKEEGLEAYADYMCARGKYENDYNAEVGGRVLETGPLWNFAVAARKLNEVAGEPVVEIGLSCKDNAETALPIFRNLDLKGMDLSFRFGTNGKNLAPEDHQAFDTDMLLTRNPDDAQGAIDLDIAAAVINFPPNGEKYERNPTEQIRLWVDGDAVAFGSSAELVYRESSSLEEYTKHEFNKFAEGIEPGPFSEILSKISTLNARFPAGQEPFEISLLTSRGGTAAARVSTIAQDLGIEFNGRLYFMGGASKTNVLRAHKPDLYLDDQMVHLEEASAFCPTGLVAYKTGSAMYNFIQEQQAKAEAKKAGKSKADEIAENAADITTPMEIQDATPEAKPAADAPKARKKGGKRNNDKSGPDFTP